MILDQSVRTHLKKLVNKVKTIVVELNLFNTYSRNQFRIQRERMTTWLFILLFAVALCILIFYTSFVTYTIVKTVQSPTQKQYEDLLEEYPRTLQCPCKLFSIPYGDLIEIGPVYHQICQSDFVQPWWYENLLLGKSAGYTLEFAPAVASHFRTIASFCSIVNLTVTESIRQFLNRILVNGYVLPSRSFNLQINASINAFQEMVRAEFLYTMAVISKLIEANQYISNRMGSTTLYKFYYPHLAESNLSSVRFSSYSGGIIYENGTYCYCVLDSKCDIKLVLEIGGFPVNPYTDLIGIYYGCFITESVLKSALLCWYMSSCIENLERNLLEMGGTVSHHITPLDSQLPSRFPLNASTEMIFNQLMIEQWNSSISYENFYRKCNPAYCTYSLKEKSSIALIVTTVIGFIGGLNVVLRLISPLIINISFRCLNRGRTHRRQQAWTNEQEVSRK